MKLKALFAAALFSGVAAVSAHAGVDDMIKARQACMKQGHGGIMAVAVPIIKGEKPYDKAAIDAAFANDEKLCADWAKFWTPDTQTGTVETEAKPEIWTDTAGWEAAGGAAYQAMQALKATTDEASFKAAFPAVGAGCKGCHEKFRKPEG